VWHTIALQAATVVLKMAPLAGLSSFGFVSVGCSSVLVVQF
jgi:hypothetical protein